MNIQLSFILSIFVARFPYWTHCSLTVEWIPFRRNDTLESISAILSFWTKKIWFFWCLQWDCLIEKCSYPLLRLILSDFLSILAIQLSIHGTIDAERIFFYFDPSWNWFNKPASFSLLIICFQPLDLQKNECNMQMMRSCRQLHVSKHKC